MKYRISTVIPVYNCEKFLERAVESVINQPEFSDIQLILVDDGSKDKSGEICDRYASKHPNILTFHQENSGVSAARNLGIKNSDAEFISFLDSDDYLLDGFYSEILKYYDSDLIICDYLVNGKNTAGLSDYFENGITHKKDFENNLYPVMADSYIMFPCWNKVFRKSIIERFSVEFPVGVKLAEDMTFVYDYIKHIESFRFLEKPLYFYFDNSESVTKTLKNSYETYEKIYTFLTDYFMSIGFSSDKILHNYVYNSIGSMHSAAAQLNIFKAYIYIKRILKESFFCEKYREEPIYSRSDGINGYKNRFIINKNPFLFILLVKYNEIRSKKIIKENSND